MNEINRKAFLKLLGAGGASFFGWPALPAWATGPDDLRGDRVGWARLKTPSPQWKRHAGSDPVLMKFFRDETTLNIDPAWYAADVASLQELCKYPFLFSQGVGMVTSPASGNLAEYIRRGGFLLIDACHDIHVTPDFDEFLRQQFAFFAAALPEAQVVELPATHEIYRCRFQIPGGQPPHTFFHDIYDARKAAHGLYGLMIGARMAGVISVCGWQCGWDHVTENPSPSPPGTDVVCMRMLVNVYIYAMMQRA
jgi:hypothetical protein